MKNSSERKRYKTNPNFDAYLLYSYIQMKRNASDKISRDKACLLYTSDAADEL